MAKTKDQFRIELEKAQKEAEKWRKYYEEEAEINAKLQQQIDNKQISEHSGTIASLNSTIKDQDLYIKQLKDIIQSNEKKIARLSNEKDSLIERIKSNALIESCSANVQSQDEPKKGKAGRPRAKISLEQEEEIVLLLSNGYSQRKVAKKYNISCAYVAKISKKYK